MRPCGHRQRGFTLMEILVVVAIIGIISAGILLSVNLTGRDSQLQKEGDRLLALMKYASEQAELQTREYGVIFQPDSYEFVAYDVRRQAWRSVFEDDILNLRKLPDGLGVKLTVEGAPLVLKKPTDAKVKTPQVMIFSTGEMSSFQVTLTRDSPVRSIAISPDSKTGQLLEGDLVEGNATGTTARGNKT